MRRLLAGLAEALNADDPRRAPSMESEQRWLASALSSALLPTARMEHGPKAEQAAEGVVRHRLELMVEEVLPAVRRCGGGSDGSLHIRPLRSRLYAALTLPAGEDAVIVVDDAVHDLTMSVARWITASWASPSEPPNEAPPAVELYDAVRVVRTELGSVRWNGALWQPVVVEFSDESRWFAAMLGELALKFVLAHEIGHIALGHLDRDRHDGTDALVREQQADAFATRVLRMHIDDTAGGQAGAGEVDGIARAAISVALGVLDAVTSTFLVRGDEHPPADERFAAVCEACGLGSEQAVERPGQMFFEHLDGLVIAGIPPLVEIVEQSTAMRFARPYDAAERRELDSIDRIEGLFHTPLPALLDALADLALLDGGLRPPSEVLAAARRAEQFNVGERTGPVPPDTWIRLAAGRWWLLDRLLGDRDPAAIDATLRPAPGTRFCDWARWVERDCPEDHRGVVLAALHVYATAGPQPEGTALHESRLPEAVSGWLADAPRPER